MSRIDSLQLSKRALGKDYSNASDIKETNRCNNASTNNEKTVLEFKSKCPVYGTCVAGAWKYLGARKNGRTRVAPAGSRPRAPRSFLRPPAR